MSDKIEEITVILLSINKYEAHNKTGGYSVTIDDVYQGLKRLEEKMATREDIEALIDSVEILSNPKTMAALSKSDWDVKAKLLPSKLCLASCEHDLGSQADGHFS